MTAVKMKVRWGTFLTAMRDRSWIECERVKVNSSGWLIIEFENGDQRWIPPHLIYGEGVEVQL